MLACSGLPRVVVAAAALATSMSCEFGDTHSSSLRRSRMALVRYTISFETCVVVLTSFAAVGFRHGVSRRVR